MRILGLASVVAIVGIAGVGAASTLRDRGEPRVTETSAGNVALGERTRATNRAPAAVPQGAPETPPAAAPATPTPAIAAPAVAQPSITAPSPRTPLSRGGFVLVEGRTALTDSIYAVRTGDSVIVHFDVQGSRTRRADRFERLVRTTLPLVYGRMATSGLDSIPEGSLLPTRDVIGALRSGGMHLTLENGARISVRALTRVGRDGALAVAYLTVVER